MSENELLLRERLDAMSEIENAKTARVLRDDELDAVSGGKVTMEDILVTSVATGG